MKKIENLKVLSNKKLNANYFLLELQSTSRLPKIESGQFVNVEVEKSKETFLRRPFSIHDVDESKNSISLLIRIVGKGTEGLSKLESNELVSVVFPLGKGFKHKNEKNVLLVGGGCGVAPMFYLAKELKKKGITPNILFGVRSKNEIVRDSEYKKYSNLFFTTEDGSFGEKGYVTNHSILEKKKFDKIYTCGPEVMMKAVAKYAKDNGIECEVSLENMMACGIGVCLGCVTETTTGRRCVCSEGPVFNVKELNWF
ncbi:dihydroorotate dehydrogenase electron transfer subunit [Pseudomonadota bacterium]